MKPSWLSTVCKASNISLIIVGLWVLLGFMTWHELVSGVRVGFPRSDNSNGQHLLFDGPVQVSPILAVIVLHLCASLIGYVLVVHPIWGGRRLASEIWLLLGGLIPGTLILMFVSRLASLFLSNSYAPIVCLVAILIATILSVRKMGTRWRSDSVSWKWKDLWPVGILLFGTMIFTLQMDRFHIVGEASSWFINDVYFSATAGIGSAIKFPLVSQHYDEAALLYPVIYGFMEKGTHAQATMPYLYWIMVSLGRVGVGSLIYISLRSLRVDRLSSMISLGFVCVASLSMNAISSRLLFDSLSPLAYALHVGRFLIPVLPLLFASALGELRNKVRGTFFIVAAVLGAGLSAMPVHAALALAWAIPVLAMTEMSPASANSLRVWRAASISASGVLLAFMVVYGFGARLSAAISVAILLFSSGVGVVAVIRAWRRSGTPINWNAALSPPTLVLLAMCAGYGVGLLLLGNIFITATDGFLSQFWPWSGLTIADRAISKLGTASATLALSPYCSGIYWEFRNLAGHCSSLPMLVRTYGLAFALMAGTLAWWTRDLPEDAFKADRQRTMVLWGIFLCLIAMPVSFVAFDFVGPAHAPLEGQRQLSIWLRSRLVEPWFYGGILLSLVFFFRDAGSRGRRVAQSIMLFGIAVGGLLPVLLPGQLIVNLVFIARGIFRVF